MEPSNQQSIWDRFNQWIEESISIKLFSIGFLILILLIPASWINDLIEEREHRADDAMRDIYQKWSGNQTMSGPILVVPYLKIEKIDLGKKGVEYREKTANYYFLSNDLKVVGELDPKLLHRGIFDAVVYNASINIEATFTKPDFKSLGIEPEKVLWNKAHLILALSDLRGISSTPIVKVDGVNFETEPSNNIGIRTSNSIVVSNELDSGVAPIDGNYDLTESNGIVSKLNWNSADDFKKDVSIQLKLKGSEYLYVTPTGKNTNVELKGSWATPSFDGNFLPETRDITANGFVGKWNILHYNRAFSQQWTDHNQSLKEADFGVRLLIPADQYQKSIRTAKYGILIILLTFIALFLVEITKRIRIHPFQYILIGVALIIYYILLLSISEQIGYNLSYIISSAATIALVSFYAASFLQDRKLVVLFSSLLVTFYGFIFIIILQEDFSLLIGSVGLFLIVGALMYFSRKVSWYK